MFEKLPPHAAIAQREGNSLARLVESAIEGMVPHGALHPGNKPTKATLCEQLGVSRGAPASGAASSAMA